jgi:hypothetical protein
MIINYLKNPYINTIQQFDFSKYNIITNFKINYDVTTNFELYNSNKMIMIEHHIILC